MVSLIYCAGGNRRYAEIAARHGFLVGACSDRTLYLPPDFIDLDHRRPDFARHLACVAQYRPQFAVAGDAATAEELPRVVEQAAALAAYAQHVIVVAKAPGLAALVPRDYVVGLSVATRFGGTQAPYWEYRGHRVHLLGGSPRAQMRLYAMLGPASVISVDGNCHQRAARWGTVWTADGWVSGEEARRRWPAVQDLPYVAFEASCAAIAAAWSALEARMS